MTTLAGRQLGDYRILESIGSGGIGEVYLAEHVHLRKKYALKALPQSLTPDRGFVARFHDEARVMAELRHPHIVEVQYMGHADGVYFLVMDYVSGPRGVPLSLHEHLRQQPESRLPEAQVRKWAMQTAEALAYAHDRGVVHRDIKPANILIDANGDVKLTDFGLAKAVGSEFILSRIHQTMQETLSAQPTLAAASRAGGEALDAHATLAPVGASEAGEDPPSRRSSGATSILGTYDYMSPEQRGEGGAVDQRSDIYSFGVLVYRLLTGKRPVGMTRPPSQAVPGLSKRWDAIVDRCLSYEPASRYPSAKAMMEDLRAAASRPRQRWLTTAAIVGLLVLSAAGLSMWLRSQAESSPPPVPPSAEVANAVIPPAIPEPEPPVPTPQVPSVTLADVVPVKSRAEGFWERVKDVDRGQDFAKFLDEADAVQRNARTFFDRDVYVEAKATYEELIGLCQALEARQAQRQEALAGKAAAEQARNEAATAQAELFTPAIWKDAKRLDDAASQSFEAGDFEQARKHWATATETYAKAKTEAAIVAAAKQSAEQAQESYEQKLAQHDASLLKDFGADDWAEMDRQVTAAKAALEGAQFETARAAYEKASELLPGVVRAAQVARRQSQFDAHMKAARDIVTSAGLSGTPPAEVSETQEARAKEALARVEQALALQPGDSAARQIKTALERWKVLPRQLIADLGADERIILRLIPAGTFMMGSKFSPAEVVTRYGGEEKYYEIEHPRHRVRITTPFYLASTEVTVGQFRRFVDATGYRTDAEKGGQPFEDGKRGGFALKSDGWGWQEDVTWRNPGFEQNDRHPVVLVSWNDAKAFCDWLTGREGRAYSLPTESQWEYACRGKTDAEYWWGDEMDTTGRVANVGDSGHHNYNAPYKAMPCDDGHKFTAPVGAYRSNGFDLDDMIGNVWEWCADVPRAYAAGNQDDPEGPTAGELRVARGGAWGNTADGCRCAYRLTVRPAYRDSNLGFRVSAGTSE